MSQASSIRAVVDDDLCEGHGMCEEILPSVFHVGEDGKAELLAEGLPAQDRDKAEEAVRMCPAMAISLKDL